MRSSTLKVYKALRVKLIEFQEYSKTTLSINNVNLEFYNDYVKFLIKVRKNSQNTVAKGIKLLKSFLNWCFENNYIVDTKFKKFRQEEAPTNIIAINLDELESLEQLILEDFSLEKVRDAFLFSCYTGQHYEDIVGFEFDKIENNSWKLTTSKTNRSIYIPLIESTLQLMEKYKSKGYNSFPMISNQKTNQKIKIIAEMAGINQMTKHHKYIGNKRTDTDYPKYKINHFSRCKKNIHFAFNRKKNS